MAASTETPFPVEAIVRERLATVPGAPILECTATSICDYACGVFELCQRDISLVLGAGPAADAVFAVLSSFNLPNAFGLRNELCNLKKVTFFVLQQANTLERQLAQLSTFWHGEHVPCAGGTFWKHSPRLEELSDARTRAKGACAAVQDARAFAKNICSLPRHPSKDASSFLIHLPGSLQAWRIAVAAEAVTETSAAEAPAVADVTDNVDAAEEQGQDKPPIAASWHARSRAALRAQGWPTHVVEFVEMCVLCRGGDKALRIWDHAVRVETALEQTIHKLEGAAERLRRLDSAADIAKALECTPEPPASGDAPVAASGELVASDKDDGASRVMMAAMRRRRHANLVAGCLPVINDTLLWLRAAMAAAREGTTRFVAGDGRGRGVGTAGGERAARQLGWQPALFGLDKGMQGALFAGLREVEARYRPQMRATIATSGWPASIASRRGAAERERVADNKVCRVCTAQFSPLWVHRGVCSECEAALRADGACPYQPERCTAAWFCVHEQRCFVCDTHGCAECRLERGGAEVVAEVAARLAACSHLQRIAVDFDRTLCNTRSGGRPEVGKHLIDDELLALLWRYVGQCEIVTRNQHTDAIRIFLDAHGAPPACELPIRTVHRGQSKADYVLAGLDGEGPQMDNDALPTRVHGAVDVCLELEDTLPPAVLMVDDSVAELAETRVASDTRVHRVLFVRALL